MIEFPPSFAVGGGTLLLARGNQGDLSEWSSSEILPLFCVGGGVASAHELSLLFTLSLCKIELFYSFAVWVGGLLLARGNHSQSGTEFSPSFAVWGGGFCSQGEAFSSHDKLTFSTSITQRLQRR